MNERLKKTQLAMKIGAETEGRKKKKSGLLGKRWGNLSQREDGGTNIESISSESMKYILVRPREPEE